MRDINNLLPAAKKFSRFFMNMGVNAVESYFLNLLKKSEIHNDLGASSTAITRKRIKIIKRALTEEAAEKLRDEIAWIREYSHYEVKEYLPTILESSTEAGNTYYVMRYYNMPNLRRVILNNMSTTYFLQKRFDFLLTLQLDLFHGAFPSRSPGETYFYDNFENKVYKRLAQGCRTEPRLSKHVDAETVRINDEEHIGPKRLFAALAEREDIRKSLVPDAVCISHGDLHTNNILCGLPITSIKLLDCRGKNSDGTLYFDPAYDVAKLYHDLHGLYSLIENHDFLITTASSAEVSYSFKEPGDVERFEQLYRYTREQVERRYERYGAVNYRADFIEAVLFITMIPFHLSSYVEGLICLVRGTQLLNRWAQVHYPELHAALLQEKEGEN